MKSLIFLRYLLMTICLLLIRCEKNFNLLDANNVERGTCYVNVEGYINKSFQGEAVYENVPTGYGNTLFFLELMDVTEPGVNYRYVELQGGDKPNTGTYDIINVESNNDSIKGILAGWYNDSEVLDRSSFHSVGGKIVITNASSKVLKGSIEFTAAASISLGDGKFTRAEIRITAVFYAEEGYTGIILN
jgi:hypothetical protein